MPDIAKPAVAPSADMSELLRRCLATPAEASTLPPPCYVNPDLAALETGEIFGRGWVGVGRADRWPANGDFSVVTLNDISAIVIRDGHAQLRAYANSCSHRATQILSGDGNCARMRCPFHFWTYNLEGRLVGAPSMSGTAGFDKKDHGLTEFHLEEREGFVFVSFEREPESIDVWLGDFSQIHAPWSLGDLVTGRRREFTVDCNWKAFAEVFNEYYHLPYVHPTSIDGTYNDPDPPDIVCGAYATHFGTTVGTGGLLEADQAEALPIIPGLIGRPADGVRYTWLFPNMMIAAGREAMWMYEVYPDGPDRSRCAQVVCFPPTTFERPDFADKAARYYARFDVAIAEDIPMLEQQHAGLRSPFAKQGRFSYLEPSVARFAAWYAGRLLAANGTTP